MNSLWIENYPQILNKSFNSLDKDISVDVCIIGGGITGISTAYMLAKSGLKVAILERDSLAAKTTGNTTAKITSQHGLFYKYLSDSFSNEFAKDYLSANEEAISNIKSIIDEENIDCDFETQDAHVYTNSEAELQKIKDEVSVLNSLGFDAKFTTTVSLPFDVLGAIKFPNQAQFHPRKYVSGLINSILNNSGEVYENTKVYSIQKEKDEYITHTKNNKVKSKYLILASHFPIVNAPGFYFLKMYQQSSYIIAVETNKKLFSGMYISSEDPAFSFRTAMYENKRIVLIGGSEHKTGAKIDLSNSYSALEQKAKELYPDSNVLYKWNTRDCVSLDKIPYIGPFSDLMPNMYVATGFKKWGMTTSNVAANIITDSILGNKNKYEHVFLSTRFHPVKNAAEVGNVVKETVHSLVLNKLKIPDKTIKDIKTDEGKIVEVDNQKVGIYKDANNKTYAIKPVCSHLGCELSWNNLDKTWDCPCHGSRFDYTGKSIYEPSIKDLDRY